LGKTIGGVVQQTLEAVQQRLDANNALKTLLKIAAEMAFEDKVQIPAYCVPGPRESLSLKETATAADEFLAALVPGRKRRLRPRALHSSYTTQFIRISGSSIVLLAVPMRISFRPGPSGSSFRAAMSD
jgi:hypothetical protein